MNEEELFSYLKTEHYPDLQRAIAEYSAFDAISYDTNSCFELKCRRTHYPDLLLEKKKYDVLMELASKSKMMPYYVCSTPEGIWKFDLHGTDIEWENRMMPVTTDFSRNDKIEKIVAFVSIDKGVKLDGKV